MQKIFLSYVVIGIYFGTVFAVSLLIALLASLAGVKRTDCNVAVRTVLAENKNDLIEPNKSASQSKNNCPDFMIYQNGTLWEDIKLPSYIRPTRYDLEISIPALNSELYAGNQVMTIELDKDTKYILFHSTKVQIVDGSLVDSSNRAIEIACGGFYQLTDYYVIITKNIIPKSVSPLKLSIKFEGRLFQTDQGIFDISYTGGQSR
jgi:hypothetical protein